MLAALTCVCVCTILYTHLNCARFRRRLPASRKDFGWNLCACINITMCVCAVRCGGCNSSGFTTSLPLPPSPKQPAYWVQPESAVRGVHQLCFHQQQQRHHPGAVDLDLICICNDWRNKASRRQHTERSLSRLEPAERVLELMPQRRCGEKSPAHRNRVERSARTQFVILCVCATPRLLFGWLFGWEHRFFPPSRYGGMLFGLGVCVCDSCNHPQTKHACTYVHTHNSPRRLG